MAIRGLRRETGSDGRRRGMREVSWMTIASGQAEIMI